MTDDAKRSKVLRTIQSLQRVIDHPNTGDGERAAAMGRVKALKEKHGITDAKPRVTSTMGNDRTGGFNSTSSSNTWINDNFKMWFDEQPDQAEQIRRQAAEYERFKKRQEADRKNAEARRKAEEEAAARAKRREEARARERAERAAAQKRWRAKHADNDHMGRPLTKEEQEEARRDPLGWAMAKEKRTAEERNRQMQDTLRHKQHPLRCEPKATFYDQGGEPRKRNDYPTNCFSCGTHLRVGEGALFKAHGKWEAVCCDPIPGPRKKKPGRS